MNINEKLIEAATAGQVNIVRELLTLGGDIHVLNDSALAGAAMNGHTETVSLLLDHGANIHTEIDEGPDTPLQLACIFGHTDTVKLLLERGADIHAVDAFQEVEGPLLHAAECGHFETVALLLDHGADIHARDYLGANAPLRRAAGGGHYDTVKLLLERGADIPADDDHVLRMAAEMGSSEVVGILLDWGNYREKNPELALVVLATIGDLPEVEAMLSRKIDELAIDLAFRRAAACGHAGIVALLLDHGASFREDRDEALQDASLSGHTDTVALILDRYQNSGLLEVRAGTKDVNLLNSIHLELTKRQLRTIREYYRDLPNMEV